MARQISQRICQSKQLINIVEKIPLDGFDAMTPTEDKLRRSFRKGLMNLRAAVLIKSKLPNHRTNVTTSWTVWTANVLVHS